MLVNQNFKAKLKHIRFEKINRAFSDHAGLLAEFNLP
jgi:endonuclease/exonuclease/phosphatase family metal-dependent hydrolase